jgi:uncharacterized protein (TIGR02246 family)
VYALPATVASTQSANPQEEIRDVLARFYEGWNTHDVEKMVSVYADDIDHINVFAEWHKRKSAIGARTLRASSAASVKWGEQRDLSPCAEK